MPHESLQPDGRAIYARRSHLGLSQQELADLAGTSKRHIGRLENGARSRFFTLKCIADVLKCSIEELHTSSIAEHATDIADVTRQTVQDHLERKNLRRRMESATLPSIRATGGIPLTCHTVSAGNRELHLRPNTLIGELAYALGRELFSPGFKDYNWLITDEDGDAHSMEATVEQLRDAGVTDVYLYKHRPPAPAQTPEAKIRYNHLVCMIESLDYKLRRFRWNLSILKERRCLRYLRRNADKESPESPSKSIIRQMGQLMMLYGESNVKINTALQYARFIDRCGHSAGYRDEIGWLCYRMGWYKTAFALVATAAEEDEVRDPIRLCYHMYFISRQLKLRELNDSLKAYFDHVVPVLTGTRMASGSPPIHELERTRVSLNDDSLNRVEYDYSKP